MRSAQTPPITLNTIVTTLIEHLDLAATIMCMRKIDVALPRTLTITLCVINTLTNASHMYVLDDVGGNFGL